MQGYQPNSSLSRHSTRSTITRHLPRYLAIPVSTSLRDALGTRWPGRGRSDMYGDCEPLGVMYTTQAFASPYVWPLALWMASLHFILFPFSFLICAPGCFPASTLVLVSTWAWLMEADPRHWDGNMQLCFFSVSFPCLVWQYAPSDMPQLFAFKSLV